MKNVSIHAFLLLALFARHGGAQEAIPLPITGPSQETATEATPEKEYFSKAWNTEVVSNVTKPSLTVYKPAAGTANGMGVVICPGGGFMALSIMVEGSDVAKWLAAKGVTAFVLRYRLAHTGEDAATEFLQMWNDKAKFQQLLAATVPHSVADGLEAVRYVRQHAATWGISPDNVGIIGFSAGGTVTAGVAFHYSPDGKPAFVAPIYSGARMFKDDPVPADAPPMFLAAATDDQLGLTGDSIQLYQQWTAAKKSVEMHIYAKGGHGFGMRKQGLPSDQWIERFWSWLQEEGLLKP